MPIYKISGEKRDGLQKYRVVVNYTDERGKKRTVERREYGKARAERTEAELREKIASGGLDRETAKAKPMTVKELGALYEAEHGREVRATTLEKKKSVLKTYVYPNLGEKPLRTLNVDDLRAWRSWLNEKTTKKGNPLKANTKNGAYRDLRALLNFAVGRGLMKSNPIKGVPLFRDPYKEGTTVRLRYYTADEWKLFLAAATEDAERRNDLRGWGLRLFFLIAYYTGMRKGEINGLRWSDIEDGSYIWVRRSVAQKLKGEKWAETPPKNESSVRRLQMPGLLVEALNEQRERQKGAGRWTEELFICGGPAPIPDTTIQKANEDYAQAAGLKRITIHEFRHSHASLLCNAGINIKEVARRLGHANTEITWMTYSHLYPKEEEKAVGVLEKI